jgi:uncharacterized membrane protein YraQ (UPF0718 family)
VEQVVSEFIKTFISILYEALPFIIAGAVIAGLLEELVPQSLVTRIIPGNRMLAIGIGAFLGLPFPMCECGIIPIMRRLLRKGVPLSCCVSYMLAGPIINVVVMGSTVAAFSGSATSLPGKALAAAVPAPSGSSNASSSDTAVTPATGNQGSAAPRPTAQLGGIGMAAMRAFFGFLVAFGTGLIVEAQHRRHGNSLLAPLAMPPSKTLPLVQEENGNGAKISWFQRLNNITDTALHDFIDITVFLILGAVLAALSRQLLSHERMQSLALGYPAGAILIMMGLAIVLCICSEADAFIAASFRAVPPAPKLAFLVLGPMLDLKLYTMYTRVFRPRLIWTIITSVVVQVLIYSYAFHIIWNRYE